MMVRKQFIFFFVYLNFKSNHLNSNQIGTCFCICIFFVITQKNFVKWTPLVKMLISRKKCRFSINVVIAIYSTFPHCDIVLVVVVAPFFAKISVISNFSLAIFFTLWFVAGLLAKVTLQCFHLSLILPLSCRKKMCLFFKNNLKVALWVQLNNFYCCLWFSKKNLHQLLVSNL